MAHAIVSMTETPQSDLRELLDKAERQLPTLDSSNIEAYLVRLDRIDSALGALIAEGVDLRTEQTRWLDLQDRLTAKAKQVVAAARAAGGMEALRAKHPPAQGPWWHLDQYLAAGRRRTLRRFAMFAGGFVVISLLAIWMYQTWFAPSAETLLLVDTLSKVEAHVASSEWNDALSAVESSLSTLPEDVDLLTWGVVLADRLGMPEKSAAFAQRARTVLEGDLEAFYVTVGMHRYAMNDLEGAAAEAESALAVNPTSAQANFILAGVAEAQGDYAQAIELFDRTATLAEDTNPQLAVVSKMRMGMLMQQPPPPSAPEPPATP